MHLYEALSLKITAWRESGYEHQEYIAIGEILEWVRSPDVPLFRLRPLHIRALKTYWYLRLAEKTAHVFDFYTCLFPKVTERMTASEMNHAELREIVIDTGFEGLIEKARANNDFVSKYDLETLRETISLDYLSYILALADVPEENDLVDGKYVVEAKKGATIAVKVTDMLDEKVLVVKGV